MRVGSETVGGFSGPGLCVLVGVTHSDDVKVAERCADKVLEVRIFPAERFPLAQRAACPAPGAPEPKELSAADLSLPVLVVSQFTLYGDTRKGRRPTWERAASRQLAEPLIERFAARVRERGIPAQTGLFGADMQLTLTNDGPVTLMIEV